MNKQYIALCGLILLGVQSTLTASEKTPKKAINPAKTVATVDQKACNLVCTFVNLNNRTLDWKTFATKMARTLMQDKCYHKTAKAFKKAASATNPLTIGWQLRSHMKRLPNQTRKVLKSYSNKQLLKMIEMRLNIT